VAWQALKSAGACQMCRIPGHAGMFETSLMLAVRPDLVKEAVNDSRGALGALLDPPGYPGLVVETSRWARIDGVTDDPRRASSELGQQWFDVITRAVSASFVRFQEEGNL